jgi:hypothetical protein
MNDLPFDDPDNPKYDFFLQKKVREKRGPLFLQKCGRKNFSAAAY